MSRTVVVKLPTDFCTLNTPLYILTPFFLFFRFFLDFFGNFFSGIISAERDAGAEKTTLPSSPQKSPLLFLSAAQESTNPNRVAQESTGQGGPTLRGVSAENQTRRQGGVCSALGGLPAATGRGNLSKGGRSRRARPLAGPLRAEAPHRNTVYPTETPLAPTHSPPGRSSASARAHPCSTHILHLLPNPTRLHRVAAPPRAPPAPNTLPRIRTHHNTLHHEPIILSYTPTTS